MQARDLRHARRLAATPWLEAAERLGYVVRGLLYGVMGMLALEIALGVGGEAVDQRGGLARSPLGELTLAVCVTGLAACAALCFVALGLHSLAYARWARTLR